MKKKHKSKPIKNIKFKHYYHLKTSVLTSTILILKHNLNSLLWNLHTTKHSDNFEMPGLFLLVNDFLNTTLYHAEDMILNINSNKIKYIFIFLCQYSFFIFKSKTLSLPFIGKQAKLT